LSRDAKTQGVDSEESPVLAVELTDMLRRSTTVDCQVREGVRAKMRLLIERLLRKYK
jgi:hypothetical protein